MSKQARKNYKTMKIEIDYTDGPVRGFFVRAVWLNGKFLNIDDKPHYGGDSWTFHSEEDTNNELVLNWNIG